MNTKLTDAYNKTRDHITENKNAYIAGASCLVTGLTVGAAIVGRRDIAETINRQKVIVRPIQIGLRNTIGNIHTYVAPVGHRGNLIQVVETGELFASQNQAAAALGCDPSTISKHLAGRFDTVKGVHLASLGENLRPR